MAVVITCAPTGPIATKADNPALPTQPDEIADEIEKAYHLGAAVAHLHFRDTNDQPTADLGVARETIELIKARCPILVQVSTGVGLTVGFEDREKLVELRPRMATLNPCSMTFGNGEFRNPPAGVRRLAARMRELGVKPELEIYDVGHVDMVMRLLKEDLLVEPLQFSIVLGVLGGAPATPDSLMAIWRRLPDNAVWQIIAVGRNNSRLTAMALAMGANARAGMEDTLHLAAGELTPGNAPLVERTVGIARALDLEIATVPETEQLLQLPPE